MSSLRTNNRPSKGGHTLHLPLLKTLYSLLCALRWLQEDDRQDLLPKIKLFKKLVARSTHTLPEVLMPT